MKYNIIMNPYEILGIDKNSTDSDIRKAYRKLAVQHHPDKGGDAEKFKEVNNAYSILSDKQKKTQYDSSGSYEYMNINPKDIFNHFFNRSYNSFIDPMNLTTHPFSGFSNQNDPFHGLFTLDTMSQNTSNTYSQMTTIIYGQKKTITNNNGNITETVESFNGEPYTTRYSLI
jgi:curved DNA-binding protein CbpA